MLVAPGSSPLTRGKRLDEACSVLISWLIPAHAGKTTGRSAPRARPRAHPRSRGENPASARRCPAARGSSPLTRGKPPGYGPGVPGRRLIPAHAGKTEPTNGTTRPSTAHPRSRGENLDELMEPIDYQGSSPLTRGKRRSPCRAHPRRRLIPAHAGKTLSPPERTRTREAHPRSRGENRDPRRQRRRHPGSSPLTRGKRLQLQS